MDFCEKQPIVSQVRRHKLAWNLAIYRWKYQLLDVAHFSASFCSKIDFMVAGTGGSVASLAAYTYYSLLTPRLVYNFALQNMSHSVSVVINERWNILASAVVFSFIEMTARAPTALVCTRVYKWNK
jgi:hypothetical protein